MEGPASGRLPIVASSVAGEGRRVLLAPWIAHLPRAGLEILPLLPVVDLNGVTLAALREEPGGAAQSILALMLADPFLRVRDVLPQLRRAGIGAVANFPTVQIVDGDASRALEAAELGVRREAAALAEFAAAGLSVCAFARDLAGARIMLEAAPSLLVLHPGVPLADWRARASAAAATARVAATLRTETSLPIFVYRPVGYGAELHKALALADGEAAIEAGDGAGSRP